MWASVWYWGEGGNSSNICNLCLHVWKKPQSLILLGFSTPSKLQVVHTTNIYVCSEGNPIGLNGVCTQINVLGRIIPSVYRIIALRLHTIKLSPYRCSINLSFIFINSQVIMLISVLQKAYLLLPTAQVTTEMTQGPRGGWRAGNPD